MLLGSISGIWGWGFGAPISLLLEGTVAPASLLLEGTGISASLVPVPSLSGRRGEGPLPPLVHLRWDRYLTLLDTCGGLSWVRKADVVSPGSRSEDSCPFPMHPIWWGSGDVPPTGTRDSCPHMAPGLSGTGWRDRFPQVAFGMQRQAWLPANLAWEAAVVLEQNLVGAGVSGLARY